MNVKNLLKFYVIPLLEAQLAYARCYYAAGLEEYAVERKLASARRRLEKEEAHG